MILLRYFIHSLWQKKDCHFDGFALFGLSFYFQVNNYGHVETVSSPYHTFFLGKLD